MSQAAVPGGGELQWRRIDVRSIPVDLIPWLINTYVGYLMVGSFFPPRVWAQMDQTIIQQGAIAVAVYGAVRVTVRWATTFYVLDERRLWLRTGLLVRRRITVERSLLRSVSLRANGIAQLLGVTTFEAGAAQHRGDVAVRVRSIPAAHARALRDELFPTPAGASTPERLMSVKGRWALFAPFSSASVSLWAGTYLVIYNVFFAWFAWVRTFWWFMRNDIPFEYALRGLVAVPIAVGILGAILLHLETWWRGTLERHSSGTLRMSSGLIVRREVTMQEARIIGAELQQPLALRWARRVRVSAVATGVGSQRTLQLDLPQARRRALMPLGPFAEGRTAMSRVLRSQVDIGELERHPRAARNQRLRWAVGVAAAATLVVHLLLREYLPSYLHLTWWFGGVALVVSVLLALDNYDALGHRVTDEFLLARWGVVPRRTSVVQRRAVVGWVFRQTWFQWRLGLVTLHASTAGGTGAYYVRSVGVTQGTALATEITPDLLAPFRRTEAADVGEAEAGTQG